jgi:hypothetical protein
VALEGLQVGEPVGAGDEVGVVAAREAGRPGAERLVVAGLVGLPSASTIPPTDGLWKNDFWFSSHQGSPSTSQPASTSSGIAEWSEAITGTPQACASRIGIPNPSPIDGCSSTSKAW